MKPLFNEKFYELFTAEELEEIVEHAMALSESVIIIATNLHFFELSADMSDELEIYCDEHVNGSGLKLTKEAFLKLYKSSDLMDTVELSLEE